MFERFSPDAREAVTSAQAEARRLHHNYIGTENLLPWWAGRINP